MAMIEIERHQAAPAAKKTYVYYPGCSLHSTAREYDVSARLVCEALNIELKELEGWICCGASAAHSTDHLLSLALPAHNLKLAEKEGLPLAVPCAMCFSRLKTTIHALDDGKTRELIEKSIDSPLGKMTDVLSLLQVLDVDIPGDKIKKLLTGLKVACYYGCLLVRPREIVNLDDEDDPQMMDRIMARLGAESLSWGLKTECCGASLTLTRPDIVGRSSYRILSSAKKMGTDCIVVACPMCHMNLDMRQKAIESEYHEKLGIPVIFFSQLMGLALGFSPEALLLKRHITNPMPLLTGKGLS